MTARPTAPLPPRRRGAPSALRGALASALCAASASLGALPARADGPPAPPAEAPPPSAFDAADAAFGAWVVGPLASLFFFDLYPFDNTLPEGTLPKDPIQDGELRLTGWGDGGSIWQRERVVPLAELEAVPVDQEAIELAPGLVVRVVEERGGRLMGATAPLSPAQIPSCSSFSLCGSPVEEAGRLTRDEAGLVIARADGDVIIPSPPDEPLRVAELRGVPVVLAAEGEGMRVVPSVSPVPRGLIPVEAGRAVRVGGEPGSVMAVDGGGARVRWEATEQRPGAVANPADMKVPMLVAWLVVGSVFFTLRMGFISLRGFGHALRATTGAYDNPDDPGEISHFKALASALSATVGLGNIAGVALAVAAGGPGAIPWMVIAGFLGMSAKFTECTLGQMYRVVDAQGRVSGGPMHYLHRGLAERGLGGLGKVLGVGFAIMCVGGSLGGGNMFQSNQAYAMVRTMVPALDGAPGAFGAVMALLVGVVILGGIRSIGNVAGIIVPFMCGTYVLAGSYVLLVNADRLPDAFALMIDSAFSLEAAGGGALGAMIQGFRRAAFSNEAGVGSASIAHSAAATSEPVREGMVALLEPFIDTILICTMTGLVVVVTGAFEQPVADGVVMTSWAFGSVMSWFPYVLGLTVVLFAYSTMISWSYYGERCATHLFGPRASLPYKVLFCLCTWAGAWMKAGNVLDFSDLMILGMAFPNILGAVILSGKVKGALDDYWGRLQRGEMATRG